MSHPNRNDPCPCGSGKKYKACHMRDDQASARTEEALGPRAMAFARERAEQAARATPVWQADVAPLAGVFPDTNEPGSLAIVVADGLILMGDVLPRRPVGAPARAQAVQDAVMAAARSAGVLPERLHVRDAVLADALGPEMERRGVTVEAALLPELEEALHASLEHLADGPAGLGSAPWTWAETEATPAELAELHAAAAAFHQAAPWRLLTDQEGVVLSFPGEDEPWVASVMGSGSVHYGLALYSDPRDLESLYEQDEVAASDWALSLQGFSVSLSFDAAADLPRPLRREVQQAGWPVAGPDAYPVLLGIGIPGRRITAGLVVRVAQACRAVLGYLARDDESLPWRDPATGVEVVDVYPSDEDGYDDGVSPWPPLERSHPVGPAGPAADAAFVLRPDAEREAVTRTEPERWERYEAWLRGQRPSKAAYQRDARAAELWTIMLAEMRVPAQAATEHELRFFLYGWLLMQKAPAKPVAWHLTRSLRRLFAWYAAQEGIEYPWAEAVLQELDDLVVRGGADDVRAVLAAVADSLYDDLVDRVLAPEREVPGTVLGWSSPFNPQVLRLRDDLHRQWLLWHDEVVRGGATDPESVREILVGRQREWEHRAHPRLDGRTPRALVLEEDAKAVEMLRRQGLLPASGQ